MEVVDLCKEEVTRSVLIKFNNYKFILKNVGIGTYGTERIAVLFVMLPNGDKTKVQTVSFLRLMEDRNVSNESKFKEYDCLHWENLSFEVALKKTKEFIIKLYGN